MADVRDVLDKLGTGSCPARSTLIEPDGDVRELAIADMSVVVGSAYWRCPACGLVKLG